MSKVGIIEYEKLVDGTRLMYKNTNLVSVECPFPVLKNGTQMFAWCSSLTTFNVSELPKLENGESMFYNPNFSTFNCNLPSLICGNQMFFKNSAAHLTSFQGNLDSLEDGEKFFYGQEGFTDFSTNSLQSLKCGKYMFYNTLLNLKSVKNIAEKIGDINGLDRDKDSDWSYQINGQTKTIEKNNRGVITLNVNISSISDQLEAAQYYEAITNKGWHLDRYSGESKIGVSPKFQYMNSYPIKIEKYKNNKWTTVFQGDIEGNLHRLQGRENSDIPFVGPTKCSVGNMDDFVLIANGSDFIIRPDKGFIKSNDKSRDFYKPWEDDGTCTNDNGGTIYFVYKDSSSSNVTLGLKIETVKATTLKFTCNWLVSRTGKYRLTINGVTKVSTTP